MDRRTASTEPASLEVPSSKFLDHESYPTERFFAPTSRSLVREVDLGDAVRRSEIARVRDDRSRASALTYDRAWLRAQEMPPLAVFSPTPVAIVDLFCGCGGLSLGLQEVARAVGRPFEVRLAADVNIPALEVYRDNFSPIRTHDLAVERLFDGTFGRRKTATERATSNIVGEDLDFLVGGPPCQGNSDLNNHTRRCDPKNALYARMARAAEVLKPKHVIIENVPGVRHDTDDVVGETKRQLSEIRDSKGERFYQLHETTLDGSEFGVPQTRRRYFLIATTNPSFEVNTDLATFRSTPPRTVQWAIEDLLPSTDHTDIFNSPSIPSAVNQKRMNWFFRPHNINKHNLPDSQRPDCHKLRKHSYVGVYGRMQWTAPAPTITSGFGCTGQGRFVHPHPWPSTQKGRTLTPHEAARLQFFPDFFRFDSLWENKLGGRTALAQMIGNAVPCKLMYALGIALLSNP